MMIHFGLSTQEQGSPEAPRASCEPQVITKTVKYYLGEQARTRSLWLVKVCIFHNKKMHVYLIIIVESWFLDDEQIFEPFENIIST